MVVKLSYGLLTLKLVQNMSKSWRIAHVKIMINDARQKLTMSNNNLDPQSVLVWFDECGCYCALEIYVYFECVRHAPNCLEHLCSRPIIFALTVDRPGIDRVVDLLRDAHPANLTLFLRESDNLKADVECPPSTLRKLFSCCSRVLVDCHQVEQLFHAPPIIAQICFEESAFGRAVKAQCSYAFTIVAAAPDYTERPSVYCSAPYVGTREFIAHRQPVYQLMRLLGLPRDMAVLVVRWWVVAEQLDETITKQDYSGCLALAPPRQLMSSGAVSWAAAAFALGLACALWLRQH